MSGEETPAQRNRRLFPGMAEFVDDMRRVFGPGVKVTHIKNHETGAEVGKPDTRPAWTADQWLHMGAKVETTQEVMARAKEDRKRVDDAKKGKGGKKV